jgi:hypothetical protein
MKLKLLALCFMAFVVVTEAQNIKGLIKDKANSAVKKTGTKVEKEAGKEIDKETDKAIDKSVDKIKGDNGNEAETNNNSQENIENETDNNAAAPSFLGGGDPAKYENSYSFDGSFTMMMKSWDKKGKEQDPVEYTSYFSNNALSFAFEFVPADKKKSGNEKSLFIYDYKNQSMIIAGNDGESKSGMVMAIPEVEESNEELPESGNAANSPKFVKTGKTKTILGYLCEEYYYKDEESEASMWLTDKLPLDRSKLYGNMEALSLAGSNSDSPNGFMMEMDSKKFRKCGAQSHDCYGC